MLKQILLATSLTLATIPAYAVFEGGDEKEHTPAVRADDAKLRANFKKLEKYLDHLGTHNKLMGSVALIEDGKVIFDYHLGFRDVANKVKADINTKYQIGSISKTYTAAMIMQLVEQQKLKLTDTLDKFFPNVVNADKITIHHLLRHESGLFNFTNDPAYMNYMTQAQTREQMLKRIDGFEVQFEPGSKHEYSNTNYILLSYIAEDITKKSFAELLKTSIVKPLGLKHTYYGDGIEPEKNEAYSYKYAGEWQFETETDMSIPTGAGSVMASAADVAKFFTALFTNKIVSAESLDKMIMPKTYGYALAPMPFYEKLAYGHGGRIDGFNSIASYIQDDKLAMVFLSNGVNMPMNDALIAILSAYYDKPFDIPKIEQKEPVGEYDLNDYVGFYGSDKIPLKINVFIENDMLMAQATGQPSIPLTPTAKDEFSFAPAGIEMRFNIKDGTFNLHQGGAIMLFSKEEKPAN